MSRAILINFHQSAVKAFLNETPIAAEVRKLLPLTACANRWGDEIYFSIPLEAALIDGKETVDAGDIAYWPPGQALCLFFGRTPLSTGEEIRPAGPVSVIGKMTGDLSPLKRVNDSDLIKVEAFNETER